MIVTDTTPLIPELAAPRRRHRAVPWRWVVPAVLLSALILLGIAVNEGAMRPLDHWGYQHRPHDAPLWQHLTNPAEIPFAGLLLLLAVIKLRHRPRIAAVWLGAFAASLLIELIGKALVSRPFAAENTLLGTSIVQGSFPSGHTMRAIVVAGAIATAWPRLRWPAVLWAGATALLVELAGMHSPSEVIGGILGGLAIVSAVWALEIRPGGRPDPVQAMVSGELGKAVGNGQLIRPRHPSELRR